MNTVYVIEHGSEPRPARVIASYAIGRADTGRQITDVEFTDERGGSRRCFASSVFPTKAEAARAEKEMEAASHATANRAPAKSNDELRGKVITTERK